MQIINKLKRCIKKHLYKKGVKTNRQIIVFESDDWGATRNSSKSALEQLKSKHPDMKLDFYTTLDCIESINDVQQLKQTLLKYRDYNGNPVKFTLNYAMANPDFDKIKASNFKKFEYETIDKLDGYNEVLEEVKSGQHTGCFMPQPHTREHLNYQFLLDDLQNDTLVKDAFDLGITGIGSGNYCGMDALNIDKNKTNNELLSDTIKHFVNIFGFSPKTYIAPCYVWSKKDELILKELGIKALQGKAFQNIPLGRDKYKKKFHAFGSISKHSGLIYMCRNCFFEPSKSIMAGLTENQIIDDIIKQIDFAFSCNKPAVICTHRVNYISGINEQNRDLNLKILNKLLEQIIQKYSRVEFMTSYELYEEILK